MAVHVVTHRHSVELVGRWVELGFVDGDDIEDRALEEGFIFAPHLVAPDVLEAEERQPACLEPRVAIWRGHDLSVALRLVHDRFGACLGDVLDLRPRGFEVDCVCGLTQDRLERHVDDALQDGFDRVALEKGRRAVPHQVLDDDLGHARGCFPALERRLGDFGDAYFAPLERMAGCPCRRLGYRATGLGVHVAELHEPRSDVRLWELVCFIEPLLRRLS